MTFNFNSDTVRSNDAEQGEIITAKWDFYSRVLSFSASLKSEWMSRRGGTRNSQWVIEDGSFVIREVDECTNIFLAYAQSY